MNMDTRRHAEKSAYSRRPKYRDDPLDSIEPELEEDEAPEEDATPAGEQDEDEVDAHDPGEPGGT